MSEQTSDPRLERRDKHMLELGLVALKLATERGWHEISVAELADAVGISARSFHRYFPRKEFVFVPVLADAVEREHRILARSVTGDLARDVASAAGESFDSFPGGKAAAHASYRVLLSTEELRPIWLAAASDAEASLAVVLAKFYPAHDDGAHGRLLASLVIAAESHAIRRWAAGPADVDLAGLIESTLKAGMQAF